MGLYQAAQRAPCSEQRSTLALRHQQRNQRRASPARQPPPFSRFGAAWVNEEMIIYQGAGQEIGHIQQKDQETLCQLSLPGVTGAAQYSGLLVSVFAVGGLTENTHCACDECRWTGLPVASRNPGCWPLAGGPASCKVGQAVGPGPVPAPQG